MSVCHEALCLATVCAKSLSGVWCTCCATADRALGWKVRAGLTVGCTPRADTRASVARLGYTTRWDTIAAIDAVSEELDRMPPERSR